MTRTLCALLLLATPANVIAQAAPPVAASEDAKLTRIFADSDEAALRLSPVEAIDRGDLRYADRLDAFFTDELAAAEKQAAEADLAAIGRIDRARLSREDRIAYDVFRNRTERALRGLAPGIAAIDRVLPLDHMGGLQVWYPVFASGEGSAPFRTVADYDNDLKRNALYAAALDRAIARFREGIAAGITQPKLVVTNMIGQFDALIAEGFAGSSFYAPVTKFPAAIPAAERARLTAAFAAQVRDVIQPAHRRVRAFLADTYLPAARQTIGLSALPGGAAYYAQAIEARTTLAMDPAAIHQLGLDELKRDTAEMEAQKAKAGFTGTLPAFFEFLRTDKRFQPASAAAVCDGYAEIAKRVDLRVREQFSLLPKTAIELRPVPAVSEKTAAPGSYKTGTADGSRPGVFYYNTYDLPARYTWLMEDLYLHEAVPGHHFQLSLAQENTRLPAFMRFDGDTAFVEGWGLYTEGLGPELGMLTDPYARVGMLYGDAVRALRLVVDTGIHTKGWTREQAIDFMIANAPSSRTAATAEVERYIAMPGQALAYKLGQLTILRLKAEAKAALGARYDVRAFHAQVLDTGSLPLPVLEAKIGAWVGGRDSEAGLALIGWSSI